jgi:hypothetical protein
MRISSVALFRPAAFRTTLGRGAKIGGATVRATVGDRVHFEANVVGKQEHSAVVVEARGENGGPPYVVRHDDGHETLVFPGPDAWVEHHQGDVSG